MENLKIMIDVLMGSWLFYAGTILLVVVATIGIMDERKEKARKSKARLERIARRRDGYNIIVDKDVA